MHIWAMDFSSSLSLLWSQVLSMVHENVTWVGRMVLPLYEVQEIKLTEDYIQQLIFLDLLSIG